MRLAAIAVVCASFIAGCGGGSGQSERDQAISTAHHIYEDARANGSDMSNGPCLAVDLVPPGGWALDIAHDPRQPIDDLPANQCSNVRSGQVDHFVELTPDGQLIRAQ
jgi:hypothetical protein